MLDVEADLHAVGYIGADDYRIRATDLFTPPIQLVERAIIFQPTVVRVSDIAILAIPRHIALEEQDVVPALCECFQERAIGGRVAIAPRRRQAEPEDDKLHAATSSTRLAISCRSSESTCAPRCA